MQIFASNRKKTNSFKRNIRIYTFADAIFNLAISGNSCIFAFQLHLYLYRPMQYSNKDIWNVSYPILLALLAQNVINVTDTAFLGHVGEVELGASAMGGLL